MNTDYLNSKAFFKHLGMDENEDSSLYNFAHNLIHNTIDGVIGYNSSFKVILWNVAISQITGYTEEEALQKNLCELLPFLINKGIATDLEKVFLGESIQIPAAEYYVLNKDKSGYFNAKVFPIFNSSQKIGAGLMIFSSLIGQKSRESSITETELQKNKNVTEVDTHLPSKEIQKTQVELQAINEELAQRVEESTREAKKRNKELEQIISEFRFVTDFMPQMVWATQADGNHDFFNKRWYEFTGLNYEETKNEGWSLVLHPDDYERTWQVWDRSLKTGQVYDVEYRMRRFDGEYVWFLARALPLRDTKGKIVKWFGTCTDIQEQRHTLNELNEIKEQLNISNQELQNRNNRLQQVNVELDNFVYTASHDLKAPLSNVEGLISLLRDSISEDSEQFQYLELVESSIKRFKVTVGDLASIAKATKESNNTDVILLEDLLLEIEEDISDLITSNKATITHQLNVVSFRYSKKDVRSVLFNLLSNAVKYRSPVRLPQIEIRSKQEGEFLILEVEDNGLGLKDDEIPKVFQKYSRLHTHVEGVEGTGIGMFIIKRMLENNGGRIEVDSTLGKGSVFRAYLRK